MGDSNTLSGDQSNNPGYKDADIYFLDPANAFVPDSQHAEHRMGIDAYGLKKDSDHDASIVSLQGLALTADQKAAIDNASSPAAGNPFATSQDLANLATAIGIGYDFRTDTGAPADGEIKLDNAAPASATVLKIANLDRDGVNSSNSLLKLGVNDAVTISHITDGTKVLNYDVSGAVTQTGGTGAGGYVNVPVTFFSTGAGSLADTDVVITTLLFDGNNTRFLQISNNLSDLGDVAAARTNLGVYSTTEVDTADTILQNQITDIVDGTTAPTGVLLAVNNLSDVSNATTSRSNLGLGNSAVLNTGTTGGTVALGDHTHGNLPTTDQKAAMDNANAPAGGNEFLTASDLGSLSINSITNTNVTTVNDTTVALPLTSASLSVNTATAIQVTIYYEADYGTNVTSGEATFSASKKTGVTPPNFSRAMIHRGSDVHLFTNNHDNQVGGSVLADSDTTQSTLTYPLLGISALVTVTTLASSINVKVTMSPAPPSFKMIASAIITG